MQLLGYRVLLHFESMTESLFSVQIGQEVDEQREGASRHFCRGAHFVIRKCDRKRNFRATFRVPCRLVFRIDDRVVVTGGTRAGSGGKKKGASRYFCFGVHFVVGKCVRNRDLSATFVYLVLLYFGSVNGSLFTMEIGQEVDAKRGGPSRHFCGGVRLVIRKFVKSWDSPETFRQSCPVV